MRSDRNDHRTAGGPRHGACDGGASGRLAVNPCGSPQHQWETNSRRCARRNSRRLVFTRAFGGRIVRRRQALRKGWIWIRTKSLCATRGLSLVGVSGPNHLHDRCCGGPEAQAWLRNRSIPMTDEMLSPFASAVAFAMSGAILLWSNHRQLELVFEAIVSATLYFLATKDYTRRRLLQRYGRDDIDLVGHSIEKALNDVAPVRAIEPQDLHSRRRAGAGPGSGAVVGRR